MPKVAVIAGTEIDTNMGYEIIKDLNIEVVKMPISKNSKEQTLLQFKGKQYIEEKTREVLKEAKFLNCDAIFLYCNSLSSSIDYKKMEKEFQLPIVTPLETYSDYSKKYNTTGVLTANANSSVVIEKILKDSNSLNDSIIISNNILVEAIEDKLDPNIIIETLGLKDMIVFFENTKINNKYIEAIIIGCTHFPYIENEIKTLTNIKILNPADNMILRLNKLLFENS